MTGVRLRARQALLVQGVPLVLVLLAGLVTAARHDPPRRPAAVAASPTPSLAPPLAPPRAPSPRAATPSPSRRATVGRSVSPSPRVRRGLLVVPGRSAVHGTGRVRRFAVEVDARLGVDGATFAAAVERVLFDPRSWVGHGLALQRVDSGPVAFRVVLASPATTDRLCRPLRTGGVLSCYQRGRAVLNATRWERGASTYGGDLAGYRVYLVNHEVGHALGRGHASCGGSGRPAPVMMQQTKGVGACRPNPWPLPTER